MPLNSQCLSRILRWTYTTEVVRGSPTSSVGVNPGHVHLLDPMCPVGTNAPRGRADALGLVRYLRSGARPGGQVLERCELPRGTLRLRRPPATLPRARELNRPLSGYPLGVFVVQRAYRILKGRRRISSCAHQGCISVPGPPQSVNMPSFARTLRTPVPVDTLWNWHARPGAFSRLTPSWQPISLVHDANGIEDGSRLVFKIGRWPFRLTWEALHTQPQPGEVFRDTSVRGPFRHWTHDHIMRADGEGGATLTDAITWSLGARWLDTLAAPLVERLLDRMFLQRHATTLADVRAHHQWSTTPMVFLVSGASGFVGSALCAFLTTGGHTVRKLVRHDPRSGGEFQWDPASGTLDSRSLDEVDVVVHLAGESIASGRWTRERRRSILESRVQGTRTLAEAMARASSPPTTFLSSSATGFYGHRGSAIVDEGDDAGTGFLAEVCQAWEAAAAPAREAGIRVVHPRFGMILSARGGALATMLPAFRMGVGGRLGNGTQGMSWISLQDALRALLFLSQASHIDGPVNLVAPEAVSNADFTRNLGHCLKRPTLIPAPAGALRLVLGDMAQALLLEGAFVRPRRLEEAGFDFEHPRLREALAYTLAVNARASE